VRLGRALAAEGEDELDFADVRAQALGDLHGREALVGEGEDRGGGFAHRLLGLAWALGPACGCGWAWRGLGLAELFEAVVGLLDEALQAVGAGIELSGDLAGELLQLSVLVGLGTGGATGGARFGAGLRTPDDQHKHGQDDQPDGYKRGCQQRGRGDRRGTRWAEQGRCRVARGACKWPLGGVGLGRVGGGPLHGQG